MTIDVTVTEQPITATASDDQVTVQISSTTVTASASGGAGTTSWDGIQEITVSATGGGVTVAVQPAAAVAATVSGGQGPQGEPGETGAATSLASAPDVEIDGLADGDVLRYSVNKWRNFQDSGLTDGGNF